MLVFLINASLAPHWRECFPLVPGRGGTSEKHSRYLGSPNAPAVDILDSASLTVLISNVSFKGYTSFLTFPAGGPSTLYVCAHGSTTPVVKIPSFVPASGHIYTIFAKGFLGGTGTQALGYQVITNK